MSGRRARPRPIDPRLAGDVRAMLALLWRRVGLPPPTPVQYDIARYLQHGPRRKVVMAFRGVGKTGIYAAYALWRLYRAPDTRLLIVSASRGLADNIARFMRRLIDEEPHLRHLRPRRGQRDGVAGFDVGPAEAAKDPSVKAVGVGGQITGSRADEILADDVETASNALTEAARRKLAERIKELDAVLKPGGRVTYLGTPQTHASIYALLADRGYETRIWPAEAPADPSVYKGSLAPFVLRRIEDGASPGAPLDPQRFDADDLAERRASYGPSGYALQFLIDARVDDAARRPLRLADLTIAPLEIGGADAPQEILWSPDPADARRDLPALGLGDDAFRAPARVSRDRAPFVDAVMAIDPAGDGADETAYAVVKTLNGRLFLTASGGVEEGYAPETLAMLAAAARAERVRRILVEANFGDGMFARLLAPALSREGVAATVETPRARLRKAVRIQQALEPVFAQHRLIVSEACVRRDAEDAARAAEKSLFYQITRFDPHGAAQAHDDRLDALAAAVSALGEALASDVEIETAASRARAMRSEVRTLLGATRGRGARSARGRRWT